MHSGDQECTVVTFQYSLPGGDETDDSTEPHGVQEACLTVLFISSTTPARGRFCSWGSKGQVSDSSGMSHVRSTSYPTAPVDKIGVCTAGRSSHSDARRAQGIACSLVLTCEHAHFWPPF